MSTNHTIDPSLPPPPPERRRLPWWGKAILLGVCLAVIVASCNSILKQTDPSGISPIQRSTYKPSPVIIDDELPTTFTSGTYLVGEDIEEGSYTTRTDDSKGCYWSRNEDNSGRYKSIIANDYFEGHGRLKVKEGEYLKVTGDCEWVLTKKRKKKKD